MLCRLCLSNSNETLFIFNEDNIQKYISKFLQLQISPEDPVSQVICSRCWHQLDSFQNFCYEIEQAQETLKKTVFAESNQNSYQNENGPLNKEDLDGELSDTEDTSWLKEENLAESNDDIRESNETAYCLGEEIAFKLQNELATKSETISSAVRRITRQSTNQKQEIYKIPKNEQVKSKRGRPKKNENAEKEAITAEKEDKLDLNKLNNDPNAKRRRGRPRKGEKVEPKVKKPRSEQCSKMLQTAKEFDEIIQKHMNLSCNICTVRLIDFAELKRHFRAVHQCRGYAVCCNKRLFKRGLVVDHINVHNDPEHFKCPKCGKVLADRMCLRNHDLLFHQTEELKTFQCAYCPKKYAKQYLLDHHSVKHVPQDECTFFCAECGKGFPTNSTLTKHVNQIHSTVYDKMCEICAKLIRGKANFERHMEEHEGIVQPQVQCAECGSWLKDKNSLRKHMYKHDGKTYNCGICGKNAPSKSALQSHMRYVHETSRMFHCTYCDKSFKKAVNLKEHMATHTGEVLYTCPHCPKTFNSKANMHSHRKKKHREEWEANRRYNKKESNSEVT